LARTDPSLAPALLQADTLTPENYSGGVRLEAVVEPVPGRDHSAAVRPPAQPSQWPAPRVVELRCASDVTIILAPRAG
jgi:hypothetical protein